MLDKLTVGFHWSHQSQLLSCGLAHTDFALFNPCIRVRNPCRAEQLRFIQTIPVLYENNLGHQPISTVNNQRLPHNHLGFVGAQKGDDAGHVFRGDQPPHWRAISGEFKS